MAKIDIETLKFILQRNEPDTKKVSAVMADIALELQAEEEEKMNKPPAVKKQFGVYISDPKDILKDVDLVGWIVQIPEDDDISTVRDRIIQSAYEFNTTPKGRRMPLQTIGEACEALPTKITKEQKLWIKTKVPLLMLHGDNTIPTDSKEDKMPSSPSEDS